MPLARDASQGLPSHVAAAGWEERVDPGTGRTFYIDHVNKRTSWERQMAIIARVFPRRSSRVHETRPERLFDGARRANEG